MTSSAKHPSQRSIHAVHRRRKWDRRHFRKMLFESLEDRRVLASFPAPISSWEQAEFVDAQAIVRFRGDATPMQIQMALNTVGAQVVTSWDELDMMQVRFITARGPQQTIASTKMLHENAAVEYAEPNLMRHLSVVPNDPIFVDEWGLNNLGQNSPYPPPTNPLADPPGGGTFDADIDAVEAWNTTTGNPNVVVAIIDSGIELTHPDLVNNIWTNPNETPDGIDNDNNGFVDDIFGFDTFDLDNDPTDENGHGTHVAGTVGAEGDNNIGVAGVAWNAKLMAVKAADAGGGLTTASIVGAQIYVTRMKQRGVNIVASNNSYGALGAGAFSFAEFDAIRITTQAGIVFVAAAGNDGVNTDNPTLPHYPSSYNLPGIISVAATDRNDGLAVFSNRGFNSVDLGAPGVAILSTFPTNLPPLVGQPPAPNVPPIGYNWLSGTSMASPMVAGAVALLRGFDPSLTVAQTKSILINSVDPILPLRNLSVSGGRLNVAAALDDIPRAEFHGTVFQDVDGDARFDAGEPGLQGWTVYVDLNNNRALDGNEFATVSQADGTYNLGATLAPGQYFIREVVQPGSVQTLPNQQSGFAYQVTVVSRTDVFQGLNFGNKSSPGSVAGIKYNDLDGDGQRDAGEPGIPGVVIYVDVNNDGKIGVGEPGAITTSTGAFQINNILPGIYTVREVSRPGYLQTEPDPNDPDLGGIANVIVVAGNVTSGLLFGNRLARDYGDAPNTYGTLISSNGPSHGFLSGFYLGDSTDSSTVHLDDEANGIPTADADGDDLNGDDDEDGVAFLTNVIPGQNATIRVDVSSGSYGSGILQGWIDFNNDGDFLDADEQILKNKVLATGTYLFTFLVPATASVADTFSRFRWGLERDMGPTGPATAGEVEDHPTSSRALAPTANDDGPFTVGRDTNFISNEFDVLANDFPGVGGLPFTIFSVDAVSVEGGLVQIDTTNNTIRYQPPAGYLGPDSFTYTISDGVRVSNPGTVTVNVVPLDPVAVDDTFNLSVGSAAVPIDVLANDIEGINGPLTVVAIGPRSAGGVATYNSVTKKIVYTPPSPTFQGADTFTYFVSDGTFTSSANVLVQVGGPAPNQIVQIEYKVLNSQGQELGVGGAPAPQVGDTITLAAFTRDLRGSFPDPIFPGSFPDASGVLSAYADVLYDASVVRPVAANNLYGIDITFGAFYPEFESATSANPGIVDEAGANTNLAFEYSLGSGDNLLFTIKYKVLADGAIKFLGNPEEDSANFTFETQVHSQTTGQPVVVPNSDIFFKHSPTIQVGASAEGEATNAFNPLDVNLDGVVTPNDAMLVINQLNRYGAGPYSPMLAAALGQGVPEYFYDVNSDGNVTPFDAKLVIDHLNLMANQAKSSSAQVSGEGEGEDGGGIVSQALGPTVTSSSPSSSSSTSDAGDPASFARRVDQLLTDDLAAVKGTPAVMASVEGDDDQEEEDEDAFFAELGDDES